MTNKLPPMPEMKFHEDHGPHGNHFSYFTLSQLQADRLAVWNAALEAAAKVCESIRDKALGAQHGNPDDLQNVMLRQVAIVGAGECAFAIRLLEERN